jgi:hypothetical protein
MIFMEIKKDEPPFGPHESLAFQARVVQLDDPTIERRVLMWPSILDVSYGEAAWAR